jgi:Bardet-Biedl syndrome 4 protein
MSATTSRERANWLMHSLYVRGEHDAALRLIEEQLRASGGMCEYALYVKGLIMRSRGELTDSLQLFQAALCLSPRSSANLKQVGRSLLLSGRHRAALDVYAAAASIDPDDWEIDFARGTCFDALRDFARAAEAFGAAAAASPRPESFLAQARALDAAGDAAGALAALYDALEYAPESTEVLTALGLAHHRAGDASKAFECLGNALAHDPRDARAVLAAAAIIEKAADYDVALVKYRVAAVHAPNSAALWSNVGMCFFGKGKLVAAVACLKRALYLDPFQWTTVFNLGVVHLAAGQSASAFHYLNAAANLDPHSAETFMYLGVALARLDDAGNARAAYSKAFSIAARPGAPPPPPLLRLNYAATLLRIGDAAGCAAELKLVPDTVDDPRALSLRAALLSALAEA